MSSQANLARQRLAAGKRARSPSPQSPRRTCRGSHLASPRPGAGGWLVPGLSSSSSSLSREGLRGAKNREKLCQGPPPLLRPPDISRVWLPVQARLLGAGEAVSCVQSLAQEGPTRAAGVAQSIPSRRPGATRSRSRCPHSAPRLLLPPPLDAPGRSQRPRLRPGPSWPCRGPPGLAGSPLQVLSWDPEPGMRHPRRWLMASRLRPVQAASFLALRSILTFYE